MPALTTGDYDSGGQEASFTGCSSGVTVIRLEFSDAQGGKVPCDRKAASIKSHMKIHLNQGSNIETAKEMVDGI